MDDKGFVHLLNKGFKREDIEKRLVQIPEQHRRAALDALEAQTSLLNSENKKARLWAQQEVELLRQKNRNRKRNKRSKEQRRKNRT